MALNRSGADIHFAEISAAVNSMQTRVSTFFFTIAQNNFRAQVGVEFCLE